VPGERIGGDPAPSVAALAAGEGTHHVRHGDAAALSLPDGVAADAVVTDPPYYDSVQYAELSAFFHAWQRALLADEFPAVFGDDGVSSAAEAVGNRHRGRSLDDYARLLGRALQAATAAAADDAPVAFTFHHGDAAAWGALLEALDAADLRVVATYPVRGESSRSVHVAGQRAVRLDSVVVCRTRRGRAPGAWSDVLARTEREARGRLRDLRDVEEVSRPDASVVVRGAALVAYSAHGEVRDRDGPVGPREALARVETVTDRLNEP
jgi:adenine-specific DNA methylase